VPQHDEVPLSIGAVLESEYWPGATSLMEDMFGPDGYPRNNQIKPHERVERDNLDVVPNALGEYHLSLEKMHDLLAGTTLLWNLSVFPNDAWKPNGDNKAINPGKMTFGGEEVVGEEPLLDENDEPVYMEDGTPEMTKLKLGHPALTEKKARDKTRMCGEWKLLAEENGTPILENGKMVILCQNISGRSSRADGQEKRHFDNAAVIHEQVFRETLAKYPELSERGIEFSLKYVPNDSKTIVSKSMKEILRAPGKTVQAALREAVKSRYDIDVRFSKFSPEERGAILDALAALARSGDGNELKSVRLNLKGLASVDLFDPMPDQEEGSLMARVCQTIEALRGTSAKKFGITLEMDGIPNDKMAALGAMFTDLRRVKILSIIGPDISAAARGEFLAQAGAAHALPKNGRIEIDISKTPSWRGQDHAGREATDGL